MERNKIFIYEILATLLDKKLSNQELLDRNKGLISRAQEAISEYEERLKEIDKLIEELKPIMKQHDISLKDIKTPFDYNDYRSPFEQHPVNCKGCWYCKTK